MMIMMIKMATTNIYKHYRSPVEREREREREAHTQREREEEEEEEDDDDDHDDYQIGNSKYIYKHDRSSVVFELDSYPFR